VIFFLLACAINLSELRSARVLDRGESQLTRGNDVVVPIAGVRQTIRSGVDLAEGLSDDEELSAAEEDTLLSGVTSVALTSPGYGTWLEYSRGLGRDVDASVRIGNGIYGLGARYGLDREPWFANVGLRTAYNTGGTWSGLLDTFNGFVKVSELKRADITLIAQGGVEMGEWVRAWAGVKHMWSPYSLEVNASAIDRGVDTATGTLHYSGGFLGGGVGFRWVHLVGELSVIRARGEVDIFGDVHDLSGLILAPSWGLQGTF